MEKLLLTIILCIILGCGFTVILFNNGIHKLKNKKSRSTPLANHRN